MEKYVNLLLCILASVALFLILKGFQKLKIDRFQGIVFNYLTCVIVGVIVSGRSNTINYVQHDLRIIPFAIILGLLFLICFNFIGITAQKVSVSAAGLSSKLSMVIPVLLNVFVWKTATEYTILNYLGLGLSIVAIFFSAYKSKKGRDQTKSREALLLMSITFVLGGILDALINYVNYSFKDVNTATVFPVYAFSVAAFIGLLIVLARHINGIKKITIRPIIGGIVLGTINYFSIYWMLEALNDFEGNGAFVFPILNLSIIIMGATLGFILFKEKLNLLNLLGLAIAIGAISLVTFG